MKAKKVQKADKVRVRLQARQMVTYDQVKEMTRHEWEELKKRSPVAAAEWIDLADINDSQELEDFEAFVCDEEGLPINPSDEYERQD